MFTGLIEEIGQMRSVTQRGQSMELTIQAKTILEDVRIGDSIAVNGVCLTVVSFDRVSVTMDVMPETFRLTNLRSSRPGSPVNLERAMRADSRYGGHIVQGHVDGTGLIAERFPEDNAVVFRIRPADAALMRYIVPKGSVTLDGISLTVVSAGAEEFSVSIIPHTLSQTILQNKQQGDIVNIECDILGKYVDHLLHFGNSSPVESADRRSSARSGLTESFLSEHGFN